MKVALWFVFTSCLFLGCVLANFINSKKYESTGDVDGITGQQNDSKLFDSEISCGIECLYKNCQHFAVIQAAGGGVQCLFDVSEADLPNGTWSIYGEPGPPGKIIL